MDSARILLADNDPDFLITRREFLERKGYKVIPVSSPTEALEKAEKEKVDLIVVDIRMENDDDEKDNSGLELARKISHFAPVLILTAYPTPEYMRQALSVQADGTRIAFDFINKEEKPETFLTSVRRILSIKGMDNLEQVSEPVSSNESETYLLPLSTWRPVMVALSLILALGAGAIATVYGEPRWLIPAFVLAIIALVTSFLPEL